MRSSRKSKFTNAIITLHLHATEDAELIFDALRRTLGLQTEHRSESKLAGAFENQIRRIKFSLTKKDADLFVKNLFSRISVEERKMIIGDLEKCIDKNGSIYLRLDKQFLISNEVQQGIRDVVRIKLKPRQVHTSSDQVIRELFS